MRQIYYIYVAFRPRDGSPCYVGKGQGKRWRMHLRKSHNPWLRRIVAKANGDIPIVVIRSGLTEAEAFEIEIALIKAIGRKKDGGPLVNMTDGGEGISGYRMRPEVIERVSRINRGNTYRLGFKASDETRAIQSALKIGRKQTQEHIESRVAPLRNRKRPPELCAKISAGKIGKSPQKYNWSPEACARQKERFDDQELRDKISAATKLAQTRPEVQAHYDARRGGRTEEEMVIHRRELAKKRARIYRARKFQSTWENAPIFTSPYSQWGDGASAGLM